MTLDPSTVHDDKGVPAPGWHKRLFAIFMHYCSPKADFRFHDVKQKIFSDFGKSSGITEVAEIGMGTAPNLRYYADRVDSIVGIDFNKAMQPYALESAVESNVPPGKLQLVVGRAEALPLPDACVDAVIATHLLCSVKDAPLALSEFLRVLRPGGRYVFLEHVAAPAHSRLHTLQHWLDPVVASVADGCHMTRDTLSIIKAAGFSKVEADTFDADMPWAAQTFSPHIAGVAVK